MGHSRMRSVTIAGLVLLVVLATPALAVEISTSFTPELRYAAVDGFADKFETHHWMSAGFDGGLREFTAKSDDIGGGFALLNEARFFPGNSDYLFDLRLKNEDVAAVGFEFSQFRKYFSPLGGVHPKGDSLRVVSSGRDLYVDVGKLEFSFALTPPDRPDVEFLYEHEYKKGAKSRLTWSNVTANSLGLKTGPVWQEIDEEVDVFEIRISDDWNGTHWVSEQKWERFTNYSKREERDLSTASTASQRKMRDHILEPKADLFSSVFELKRWLWKDKALARAGYRYAQIENSEVETILEMNESGIPTTFANAHQVAPSPSTNQYGSHTGVLSLMLAPAKEWTFGLKGKAEEIKKNGQSTLRNDNAGGAPDGFIDRNDVSETNSRLLRFGESLTVRYTGIPNLSLYNEVELEQNDNDLVEDRRSSSAGEVFYRETLNRSYRGVEEAGFHYHPNSFLLWATNYRLLKDNIDYDDQVETVSSATGAKSAFMDSLHNESHEVTTRATLNFCEWFSPTLKYQYRDRSYTGRFEGGDLDLRADTLASVYTADLPLKTVPELFILASWQFQDTMTVTPANEAGPSQNLAPFHGDVNTWSLSADYLFNKDVTLNSSFQYQLADNVMDISSTGVPFGADYDKVDLEVGLTWRVGKNVTLEPKYSYHTYTPNSNVEFGEYDAHIGWLGVSVDWA